MDPESFRVGQGFDVHAFAGDEGRPLVLGGFKFASPLRLVGHSDADVVAHACIDAVLGAAGAGDIGVLFPDHVSETAGADSIAMLGEAVARITELGWMPVNIDCTVVLDEPKIAPHREVMMEILSKAVGAPVWVKGKRTEGVQGLAGGIQCHAIALVRSVS